MSMPRNFFILIVLIGGSIWLQVFLSRRESRWPGLVLPGLCLLLSLVTVFNIAAFETQREAQLAVLDEAGRVVEVQQDPPQQRAQAVNWASFASVFVLYNIPTALYGAIYAACRGRRSRSAAADKMALQDLE